jgi:hypothetical protein
MKKTFFVLVLLSILFSLELTIPTIAIVSMDKAKFHTYLETYYLSKGQIVLLESCNNALWQNAMHNDIEGIISLSDVKVLIGRATECPFDFLSIPPEELPGDRWQEEKIVTIIS